jgi:small subunit ribosomal protein S9
LQIPKLQIELMAETTEATPTSTEAPAAKPTYTWGVGRRKTAVARVRIAPGNGKVEINGRPLNDFLTGERDRKSIFGPIEVTNTGGKIDVFARCTGGGPTGQAGAIVMAWAAPLPSTTARSRSPFAKGAS